MDELFIVTGACGHLGNTVIKKLKERGEKVRGLVLPQESLKALDGIDAEIVKGDICDIESLKPLFYTAEPAEIIVIHTAGIVTIASKYDEMVSRINVSGTENIVKICIQNKVKRLIYVSSVHAIPEKPKGEIISEIEDFDPINVTGLYAKTKAEATKIVKDSIKEGIDAVIVHPSAIIGPQDYGKGHITQMMIDFLEGRLKAGLNGGFDFVDVRDVADGIIAAAEKGHCGESYILSNRYYTVKQLFDYISDITGQKKVKIILPMGFVRLTAPLSELYYKLLKQPPLFTSYSVRTLGTESQFSHKKAEQGLAYTTTDISETIRDTINWLRMNGRVRMKS